MMAGRRAVAESADAIRAVAGAAGEAADPAGGFDAPRAATPRSIASTESARRARSFDEADDEADARWGCFCSLFDGVVVTKLILTDSILARSVIAHKA